MRREGAGEELVFGTSPTLPFQPSNVRRRALADWKRAGLDAIGLHECRHTFASLMIAAGVNAKALSTYMGHASVTITFDRYGHLMPGNETHAASLLDSYLATANGASSRATPSTWLRHHRSRNRRCVSVWQSSLNSWNPGHLPRAGGAVESSATTTGTMSFHATSLPKSMGQKPSSSSCATRQGSRSMAR